MIGICLCMIVRDEAAVIERCVASVQGLIDSWVIVDTGSIDGTQDVIRAALSQIPGRLHERPWVDFATNRTELLELAGRRDGYLLLLDADDTVQFDAAGLEDLDADCYMLRYDSEQEYRVGRLIRADRRWYYVGAVHEYLTSDEPEIVRNLDAIVLHHHGDGSRSGPARFEQDVDILAREVTADPNEPRSLFYLAQTLKDLGRLEEAVAHYRHRALMGGFPEEAFYAAYQTGVLTRALGRDDEAMMLLWGAWSMRPSRVEPLYELAWMYRSRGMHEAAYLVCQRGLEQSIPDDLLFVARWIYDWGLLFEASIAAYWTNRPAEALRACDQLLEMPDLPENFREQVITNRTYSLAAITAQNGHTAPFPPLSAPPSPSGDPEAQSGLPEAQKGSEEP